MLRDETHFFPTAAAHAIALLDASNDSLTEAITVASISAMSCPDDMDHWLEVLKALDHGAEA